MSNAMFVSKLDSRINDLIESGKVAVDSATEKTSKHGTATRFVCTFDAEHAAGLFDETTGVNANKLTDRDQFAQIGRASCRERSKSSVTAADTPGYREHRKHTLDKK